MQKASIVKGTRDFGPAEVAKRKYIFNQIEVVFKQFGFAPIETPSLEKLSTLTGKYGDEGDQLLFKVLKNGDIRDKVVQNSQDEKSFYNSLTDKGLRYDLTVPFARFVSMNRHQIKFPFKRYQMQQVWRADRPQKGRYREFWQCDADSIGTKSLICEMECLEIFDKVFDQLNIPVTIHLNHRKLLESIAESMGYGDNFNEFSVAIDKLDKIGKEGVLKELENKSLDVQTLDQEFHLLKAYPFTTSTLGTLKKSLENEKGQMATEQLKELLSYCSTFSNDVVIDTSLARGLSYYTGCIFEVKPKEANIGSIAAGGRYDDLTEVFGVKDVSGVGISFGADRIFDILEQQKKYPHGLDDLTDVLVCAMDETCLPYCAEIARSLRVNTNLSILQYPDSAKLKKQLDYANALHANYAIIVGSNEIEKESCMVKNLTAGTQAEISIHSLSSYFND
jgi:histidyl-tRNA synthetase